METTLTINIDQNVVDSAEIYAKYTQKSISQLVEEYLVSISSKKTNDTDISLGPITRQLAGIIEIEDDTSRRELLEEALLEKYL